MVAPPMTEVPTMLTDPDDDKPLVHPPMGAQIHHHQGVDLPQDWTWLCGHKEAPEVKEQQQ
jgi:hypothetical protein